MEQNKRRYWLTPPDRYAELNREFAFDFDPCPFPRPEGYNSLEVEWGRSNYVNPPFRKEDVFGGSGFTAFIHKAIEENKKGKRVVLITPVNAHINLLLEAGAEVRSAGRFPFLDTETRRPSNHPHPAALFILK
mgnify:CR=1 FL=1